MAIGNPMRSRGIDYPRVFAADHRNRFARGIVGQAKDRYIRIVQRFAASIGIFALVFREVN